jgi:hypothetical protein
VKPDKSVLDLESSVDILSIIDIIRLAGVFGM